MLSGVIAICSRKFTIVDGIQSLESINFDHNFMKSIHIIILLRKKTEFHWLRALTWPVNILSYSLACARLPVYISY